MSAESAPRWQSRRAEMPVAAQWAYLDHAAVAPLSGPAQRAITTWAAAAAAEGDTSWTQWVHQAEATRSQAASLLNADTAEIALVANTTAGVGIVAEGFPWRDGDNMVIPDNEFPSNAYPWLNLADRGVEVRRIKTDGRRLDLTTLLAACDGRTRLISLSWVGYVSGWRTNVEEIVSLAHQRGILVCLDAIQGMGVFPLDVRRTGIDFLAADGHKWMLGPEGAGVFFVRQELLDTLRPTGVGWNSVVHSHDYAKVELRLRPTAARFEGGSMNLAGQIALGASLTMLSEWGLSANSSPISERVLELTDQACSRLDAIGAEVFSVRDGEHRSGIVSFRVPGSDPAALRRHCLEHGVVLSCRSGLLRISPHAYCTETDLERLIGCLG